MNTMNTPRFTAEASLSSPWGVVGAYASRDKPPVYKKAFHIVPSGGNTLSDQSVIMADSYGCGPGTYCKQENVQCIQYGCIQCTPTGPTQCTKSWKRWNDPWYTRCQDYDRYTDGTLKSLGGDYWCGYGDAAYAHYPTC